jgi:hypothetical protein
MGMVGTPVAGQLGIGGAGGTSSTPSGGGGGGLYGGGGGGDACGGGGGSGGFGPGTSSTSFGADSSGTPSVTITYVVPPTVLLASPANGGVYSQFGVVYAGYVCTPGTGTTISSCAAPAANGAAVDTATPGQHTFTVTATDADGGTAATSVTYTVNAVSQPPTGPVLSSLKVAKSWSERRGTVLGFTLNERATVSFAFTQRVGGRKVNGKCVAQTRGNRRKPACKRSVTRGTLRVAGDAGKNTVFFQGRISARNKLRPGRYTLVITAVDSARRRSSPKSFTVTILK